MSKLAISILATLLALTLAADKVQIDVYYESLCGDSQHFFLTQLWAAYKSIGDIMDVNLVAYGNANYTIDSKTGKYNWTCQHGPNECYGNKVEVCAKDLIADNKTLISYVTCAFNVTEAHTEYKALQPCAKSLGLDWDKLHTCAMDGTGDLLLMINGFLTSSLKPPHTFIPWIVINGNWTQSNQDHALSDLIRLVCKTYKGTKPKPCWQ